MSWRYEGYDAAGKPKSGSLDAIDERDARERLHKQGVFVTSISHESEKNEDSGKGRAGIRRRGKLKDLVVFTRELSVLVSSGTPVVEALAALERQSRDARWRDVISGVRTRVEEGSTLADAMEAYPKHFDPVARSLVNAGESAGNLDEMLARLAALTRQRAHIKGSVKGAMVYPILLVSVSSGVLVVMMTVVLPRFAGLFETLDVPLPPTTQFLMTLGAIMRGYWWAMIIGAGLAGAGAYSWSRSEQGRSKLDSVVLNLPVFGKIVRSFSVARIARVLGILVQSKVPLLDALKLTLESTPNRCYAALIANAEDAVTKGESVSSAFLASDLVQPSVSEAIRNGEQSGAVGRVLSHVADHLDEDNEVVLRSLTSILEPVILIVLGVVVAFVAVSMFLPLFDLTSMTQGGT